MYLYHLNNLILPYLAERRAATTMTMRRKSVPLGAAPMGPKTAWATPQRSRGSRTSEMYLATWP